MAVLNHIERSRGAPATEEIKHSNKAREHFLKYCDTGKCIRGNVQALNCSWHEGYCLDCNFNPYNMN